MRVFGKTNWRIGLLATIFFATLSNFLSVNQIKASDDLLCDGKLLSLTDFSRSTLDRVKEIGLGVAIGDASIAKCDGRSKTCILPLKFGSPDGSKVLLTMFPDYGSVHICRSTDIVIRAQTIVPGDTNVHNPGCSGIFDYRHLTLSVPPHQNLDRVLPKYINHLIILEVFKKSLAEQSNPRECFWPTSANGGNLYYEATSIYIDADRSAIITEIMDKRENKISGSAISMK
jgi:hypothetical protein